MSNGTPSVAVLEAQTTRRNPSSAAARKTLRLTETFVMKVSAGGAPPRGAAAPPAGPLPTAPRFPPLRAAGRGVLLEAFDVFAAIGATLVNVHPDPVTRSYPRADATAGNVDAVAELAGAAAARGLTLMVENMGRSFGTAAELAPLLDADPAVHFHLDVGHAHLAGDTTAELLDAFGDRLAHVHVSDNFGADDLHLPLGAGSVDWREVVEALRGVGYDGTVTVEVHSDELH